MLPSYCLQMKKKIKGRNPEDVADCYLCNISVLFLFAVTHTSQQEESFSSNQEKLVEHNNHSLPLHKSIVTSTQQKSASIDKQKGNYLYSTIATRGANSNRTRYRRSSRKASTRTISLNWSWGSWLSPSIAIPQTSCP